MDCEQARYVLVTKNGWWMLRIASWEFNHHCWGLVCRRTFGLASSLFPSHRISSEVGYNCQIVNNDGNITSISYRLTDRCKLCIKIKLSSYLPKRINAYIKNVVVQLHSISIPKSVLDTTLPTRPRVRDMHKATPHILVGKISTVQPFNTGTLIPDKAMEAMNRTSISILCGRKQTAAVLTADNPIQATKKKQINEINEINSFYWI